MQNDQENIQNSTVLSKHDLEATLYGENRYIKSGKLKDENPLDSSDAFRQFCEACRTGSLGQCQRWIQQGVNLNARDEFDYTPLILASLCGHYEVVELLLEAGASCERDTFQGERCLYNALNDRIRNLLLQYDYSKARDPLQPYAAHITSLLEREVPATSDITLATDTKSLHLHKFILSARSPYFAKKLAAAPDTTTWKVSQSVPSRSLEIAIESVYLGELNIDLSTGDEDQAILIGIEKLCQQLEIGSFLEKILDKSDYATMTAAQKRVANRQRQQERTEEVERGRDQIKAWFNASILANQIHIDYEKADKVQWDRVNGIFADVLLCAVEDEDELDNMEGASDQPETTASTDNDFNTNGIPIGPHVPQSNYSGDAKIPKRRQATLIPAHKAVLIRSEYFLEMFSSPFKEAQPSQHLPVIPVDCSPSVLRIILEYLYTEETSGITLDLAIDVLFAADYLFIEKLKTKAATVISTLGHGEATVVEADNSRGDTDVDEVIDVYGVVRAGWDTRVHRLEEFGARYIAQRLEKYIDDPGFVELVKESAARIQARQETDTIELIDDIRYYLSERFRLRFEDIGLDEDEIAEQSLANGDQPLTLHDTPISTLDQTSKPPSDGPLNAPETAVVTESMPAVAPVNGEQHEGNFGVMRTLDGELAGDEFAQDAINYQILLGKIDELLESLHVDA